MTTRTCTGTRGLRTAAAVAVAMLAVLALPRAALAATSAVEMTDFEDNGYATRVLVKVSGRSGGPYYMCSPCSNGATATWGTTSVPFSTGDTLLISFQYRSGSSWFFFSSTCATTWDEMTAGVRTCSRTHQVGSTTVEASASLTTVSQWVGGRSCAGLRANCASDTCLDGRCCNSGIDSSDCSACGNSGSCTQTVDKYTAGASCSADSQCQSDKCEGARCCSGSVDSDCDECDKEGECVVPAPPGCAEWLTGTLGIIMAVGATVATIVSAGSALMSDVDTELPDCDDLGCGDFMEAASDFVGLGTDSASAAIYFTVVGVAADGAAQTRGRAAVGFSIVVVLMVVWWFGGLVMRLIKVLHKPSYVKLIADHKLKHGDCTMQCLGSYMCSPSIMIAIGALFNVVTAVSALVAATCLPLVVLRANAAVQAIIGALRLTCVTLPSYKQKKGERAAAAAARSYENQACDVEMQDRVAKMKAKVQAKAKDEVRSQAMAALEQAAEDACPSQD